MNVKEEDGIEHTLTKRVHTTECNSGKDTLGQWMGEGGKEMGIQNTPCNNTWGIQQSWGVGWGSMVVEWEEDERMIEEGRDGEDDGEGN